MRYTLGVRIKRIVNQGKKNEEIKESDFYYIQNVLIEQNYVINNFKKLDCLDNFIFVVNNLEELEEEKKYLKNFSNRKDILSIKFYPIKIDSTKFPLLIDKDKCRGTHRYRYTVKEKFKKEGTKNG